MSETIKSQNQTCNIGQFQGLSAKKSFKTHRARSRWWVFLKQCINFLFWLQQLRWCTTSGKWRILPYVFHCVWCT